MAEEILSDTTPLTAEAALRKCVLVLEKLLAQLDSALKDAVPEAAPAIIARVKLSEGTYVLVRFRSDADVALSARQREIALLASEGLSNNEIAERLRISRGTVCAHLQQVYRKLRVTSRSGLARYTVLLT